MTTAAPLILQTGPAKNQYDAVVIGSGPNGLACAITLARAGRSVLVLEGAKDIGGGMRSLELTQPGFVHDVCSAVHPLGVSSPFFTQIPLGEYGLEWIYPEASVVHAFTPDRPVLMYPSVEQTVAQFPEDAKAYRRLLAPFLANTPGLLADILHPFSLLPRHPMLMARFGWQGIDSTTGLARRLFSQPELQGLFAGLAAHSILPLENRLTAAVGLMFAVMGHLVSWPITRGGSGQIAAAMARYLQSLGGEIVAGTRVQSLADVPRAKAYFFDTNPRDLAQIAGDRLPEYFRNKLKQFRHGPGVFKIDWALSGPVPWKHPDYAKAATVHIGGTLEDVADAERAAWEERQTDKPFVLYVQASQFDDQRAPAGKHTGWGYCHVPAGSTFDMTQSIESRVEEFAPGFKELIIQRHVMNPAAMAAHNPNYVGGDITGGIMDAWQTFVRPVKLFSPYSTPARDVFLCSSSTPPGPGVHGMCGFFAAQAALKTVLRD